MQLSHVALLVPEYDPAIDFFTAIGFSRTEDTDQGEGRRWVVMTPPGGGSALVIARATGEQHAAIGWQAGGRVGFFLRVDDFAASAAAITMAGGMFEASPRIESYGTVAVFRDPFGNRWDLIGPPG